MEPLNLERELTGSLSSSYRGSSTNSMAGQGEGITSQQKEMGTFLGIVGVIMVLFAFLAHHSQRVVKARQIAAEQEAEIEDAKKRQEIIGMFESVKCIMTVSTRQLIYNTQQQVMSKQSSSHDHQHVAESCVIIRTTRHETQRTNDEENGRWRQQEETSTSIMDNNCGIQQEGDHALLTSTHTNNKDSAHTTTISVSFDLGSTAGSLLSSSSSKMKLSRKLDSDLEVGGHQCYPDNKSGESCLPAPDDENEERMGVSDILFLSLEGEQSKKSYVPNCCAICIESYQCNQVVVWSPNDDCCHAYHQDCMVEYILSRKKTEDSKVLCPTCKKCFINIARAVEEEKVLDESIKRPSSGRRNET